NGRPSLTRYGPPPTTSVRRVSATGPPPSRAVTDSRSRNRVPGLACACSQAAPVPMPSITCPSARVGPPRESSRRVTVPGAAVALAPPVPVQPADPRGTSGGPAARADHEVPAVDAGGRAEPVHHRGGGLPVGYHTVGQLVGDGTGEPPVDAQHADHPRAGG